MGRVIFPQEPLIRVRDSETGENIYTRKFPVSATENYGKPSYIFPITQSLISSAGGLAREFFENEPFTDEDFFLPTGHQFLVCCAMNELLRNTDASRIRVLVYSSRYNRYDIIPLEI